MFSTCTDNKDFAAHFTTNLICNYLAVSSLTCNRVIVVSLSFLCHVISDPCFSLLNCLVMAALFVTNRCCELALKDVTFSILSVLLLRPCGPLITLHDKYSLVHSCA